VELRPGYKQTDVGVVPEDWEAKLLPEVVEITNGRAHEQFIVSHGKYVLVNAKFISSNGMVRKYTNKNLCSASRGTIILVMSDVPNGKALARCFLVDADDRYAVNQSVCALKAKGDDPAFLFYLLNRNPYFLRFDDGVQQTHLLSPVFLRCPIVLPPSRREQRAIAEALSDVDALLDAQDRLIAKKRDLKQAAMQQLLTGQTRLPGFHGEWEVKRLGDVARIKTGSRNNEDKAEDGQYPFFVRSDFVERINSYSYDCEAILVPGEGRIGSIFHYVQGRFDVHQRVYAITQFKPDSCGRFIHFYLSMNFGAWAMQNTVKATVDSLRLPTFVTFEMFLPPTLEEQAAIAEVLGDMDVELAGLEQRRDKTRALKQAMMQELLTGRTRLV
jgi:type I restriction enzyme S subunit